eukprot:scaffold2636_cov340-Pavlova_lutheri.AAC.154
MISGRPFRFRITFWRFFLRGRGVVRSHTWIWRGGWIPSQQWSGFHVAIERGRKGGLKGRFERDGSDPKGGFSGWGGEIPNARGLVDARSVDGPWTNGNWRRGGDPAPSRPRWDQPAKGKAGCGSGRRDEIFVGRSWCWSPVRPGTPHQKDTAHGDRSHGSLFCLNHTSKGGRRRLTWNGRIRMHRRWQGGANQGRGPLAMSKGRTTSWTR